MNAWSRCLPALCLWWAAVDGFVPLQLHPRRQNVVGTDMCGLVALIGQDPDGPLEDIIAATERVKHRGPDGMEIKTERHRRGMFALGHTRLSIMDPSHAGDQPFALTFPSAGGHTFHLAANGEIYNHELIYEQLAADGWTEPRKSGSDCEVIAHAYAKYGAAAVSRLDGMFAFTILEQDPDGNIVSTLAARDAVGIKPLYHGTSAAGSHVLASELKSLVGMVDPATVTALPPGHYWTPEDGLTCFYNPDWLRQVSSSFVPFWVGGSRRNVKNSWLLWG